jgi:hypothetical protein
MSTDDALNAAWSHPWRVDPCGVVTVERACEDEPQQRGLKWYDAEHRYVRYELIVCTEPNRDSDLQVFGMFVLHVEEYATRGARPIDRTFSSARNEAAARPCTTQACRRVTLSGRAAAGRT